MRNLLIPKGALFLLLFASEGFFAGTALAYGKSSQTQQTNRRQATAARKPPSKNLRLDPRQVNDPKLVNPVGPGSNGAAVLRAEILLDRAHFSPGQIDDSYGDNLNKAITVFQRERGLDPAGTVDSITWEALNREQATVIEQSRANGAGPQPGGTRSGDNQTQPREDEAVLLQNPEQGQPEPEANQPPALVYYTIAADDVAGPFTKLPKARNSEELMLKEAKLPRLNYGSSLEAIAAKFHVSPRLLTRLNPRKNFDRTGEEILVPNVLTAAPAKAAWVVVTGSERSVTAIGPEGRVLAYYPATVGSEHDPLPVGQWKIRGKSFYPKFHYNPNLFWDSKDKDAKATLPPGPKNPVGVVWIDLSKEHYGIHGTPNPATVGKAQSHGCIRLTNWDAEELANMVEPGTPVILQE